MKASMKKVFTLFLMIGLTALVAKETPDFIFKYWKNTTKITHDTIESDAHNAFLDIYVNELAKDAYLQEKTLFPVGSIVYKPLYADPYRKQFARLVIMVKMKKGYDPKNGDWWYGVYDESGTDMYYQGRIRSCIVCHEQGKETDYMFSKSVNKRIDKMLFNSKRSWKK
ncbi:MAG: cytochrome P460 family protein [Thiovulaceae bacterium]|nr:cytochrome P460 family protein [Sulfurimonadaceae bacterium]